MLGSDRMVAPSRLMAALVVAFVGAVLAPALSYLGVATPIPASVIGLVLVAVGPGLICRSGPSAAVSSLLGSLAAFFVWLTILFVPPIDGLIQALAAAASLDPLLSYVILFSGMCLVAGLLGVLTTPREVVALAVPPEGEAQEERGAEEAAPAVRPVEAGAGEGELLPTGEAGEALQVQGEVVYVKCAGCGGPVPIEATFCPNCGRRIKPE